MKWKLFFWMPTKKMSLVFHDVSIWTSIKQREIKFSLQGKKIDECTGMDVRLSILNKIIYNKRTWFITWKHFKNIHFTGQAFSLPTLSIRRRGGRKKNNITNHKAIQLKKKGKKSCRGKCKGKEKFIKILN